MTSDNFCFYLQNRLIQTSQTGGQQYSDTSPFSIPCSQILNMPLANGVAYFASSSVTKEEKGFIKLTPLVLHLILPPATNDIKLFKAVNDALA
jgi:hypothetical protein